MAEGSTLNIRSSIDDQGKTHIVLEGPIDELADLTAMVQAANKSVVIDLAGVTRINSVGVSEWIRSMKAISADAVVWWEKVSTPMVMQLNMIANFNGTSRIRSFYAPYYCAACESEQQYLLDVDTHFADRQAEAPEFNCPECNAILEFDDVEEDYLGALMEALKEAGQ